MPVVPGRPWEVLLTAAATVLLAYQVSFNLRVFLAQPTVFLVHLEAAPAYRLPPLSICPFPPFEPTKLRSLGLNLSGDYHQFQENYLALAGVPGHLPAAQLWQEAGWEFGQVIKYMHKDGEGWTMYEAGDLLPPEWRRSHSPLGPCLTLLPPQGKTEVTVALQAVPHVPNCQFLNSHGEQDRYSGLQEQCGVVESECNSSCGLEDYIYLRIVDFQKIHVYFHETPMDVEGKPTEEDILKYSEELFDGNYILKELMRLPNLKSRPQLVESSLVKSSCDPDASYSPARCFRQLHTEKALQELGCYPVYSFNFREPSEHACRSPELMQKLFSMEVNSQFACRQRCQRRMWVHDITEAYDNDFSVSIVAASTDLRREMELKTYPLPQLFSDTGGSLGLFLGVSLLALWRCVMTAARRVWGGTPGIIDEVQKRHILALTQSAGTLVLCVAAGAHCLQVVRTYLTQPRLTSVYLTRTTAAEADDLTAVAARHLAARALDCRPQETSGEECRLQCLLEEAASEMPGVAPFIKLDGLPPCKDASFSLPAFVYVVPPEMLLVTTVRQRAGRCEEACRHLALTNSTQEARGLNMSVDHNHSSFSLQQLMCSIGGIVGLYLGWSLLQALDLTYSLITTQNCLVSIRLTKDRLSKIHQVIKTGLVLFVMTVAVWQLHTFLLLHEISSSINKTRGTTRAQRLALTVCRWPPLSLPHVATELGLDISEKLLLKLPKEERLPEVLRILDTMPGNWSSSLDVMWARAAWNISDIVEGFTAAKRDGRHLTGFCSSSSICQELWTPVMTPLNQCFSLNMTHNHSEITEITLVFPEHLEKKDILGNSPQIYFTVNPSTEPLLLADIVPKTVYRRILATHHVASYERLHQRQSEGRLASVSHNTCVHRCLSEAATASLLCRLPYVSWRPDLPLCHQQQYLAIPRFFKGLEGIGRDWKKLDNRENISKDLTDLQEKCYSICRHLRQTFHTISVKRVWDSYPTVVVRLEQKEEVLVREEDLHTASRFLSDFGGIAGCTSGFSLLVLLKKLVPQTRRHD